MWLQRRLARVRWQMSHTSKYLCRQHDLLYILLSVSALVFHNYFKNKLNKNHSQKKWWVYWFMQNLESQRNRFFETVQLTKSFEFVYARVFIHKNIMANLTKAKFFQNILRKKEHNFQFVSYGSWCTLMYRYRQHWPNK